MPVYERVITRGTNHYLGLILSNTADEPFQDIILTATETWDMPFRQEGLQLIIALPCGNRKDHLVDVPTARQPLKDMLGNCLALTSQRHHHLIRQSGRSQTSLYNA